MASSLQFSIGLLFFLVIWPLNRLAPIAIAATAYFAAYLSASAVHAILSPQNQGTLFASLFWFVPLQAFNIVNRGRTARALAWILLAAPLASGNRR